MSKHFPAALYLPPDAFDVASNQVIGRRIAGRLLSRAFAQQLQPGEILTLFSPGQGAVQAVTELLVGSTAVEGTVRVGGDPDPSVLMDIGAIHFPDPLIGAWSRLRSGLPSTAFSLTGVIHTVCSDSVLRGLGEIPLAPLYPWDAVVCTSTAGRSVVANALEQRLEAVAARFGLDQPHGLAVGLPELPVIPLVSDVQQPYQPELSRCQRRQHARQALGISAEAFVVAFVGRLSFHSKCHPLSLYRALDAIAADPSAPPVLLIECGHIYNTSIAAAYDELRSHFPRLEFRLIGGLQPAPESEKWQVLAAADVFTSPADNLQETFGLTLLEAMAAELPLVVSDWNGYRDLVEHGRNGFLVPTLDVLAGLSEPDDIETRYASGQLSYDLMIGLRSFGVILDHESYIAAFQTLLEQPRIRQQMASASLEILGQRFSPVAVVRAYRQLWGLLANRRLQAANSSEPESILPPLKPSYGRLFRHYATQELRKDSLRPISAPQGCDVVNSLMNQSMLQTLSAGRLSQVLALLQQGQSLSCELIQATGLTEVQALYVLAALHKLGFTCAAELDID